MVDFHRFSIVCFHGHVILQVKSHHTANEHQDPKAHESRTWQLHAENHGDFSATWRFHKPRIWIKTPKPFPCCRISISIEGQNGSKCFKMDQFIHWNPYSIKKCSSENFLGFPCNFTKISADPSGIFKSTQFCKALNRSWTLIHGQVLVF